MRSHSTRDPSSSSTSRAGVPAGVHDGVVPLAQQGGIRQIRRAAIGPVNEVMRVRPLTRHVAPRIGAVPVAEPQPLDLRGGEQPHVHAEVDHRARDTQHRGDDRGVTRQAPHRLGREQGAGLRPTHAHPRTTQPTAQGLQVDGDEQLALGVPRPLVGGRNRTADQRHQRLTATAVARAQVTLTIDRLRRRQRTQRRLQHRLALRVQRQPVLRHTHLVHERLRQRHEPLRRVLLPLQLHRPPRTSPTAPVAASGTPADPPPPRSGSAPPTPSAAPPPPPTAAACPPRTRPPRHCAPATPRTARHP